MLAYNGNFVAIIKVEYHTIYRFVATTQLSWITMST